MRKLLLAVVGLLCLAYAGNARVVKTGRDLEARQLTGNLIGNVTGDATGNAGTATALAANPTDCSANQFAQSIAASGNLTCAAIATADLPAGGINTPKFQTVTSGGTASVMCYTGDGKIGKCTAGVDSGVTCTCAAF